MQSIEYKVKKMNVMNTMNWIQSKKKECNEYNVSNTKLKKGM